MKTSIKTFFTALFLLITSVVSAQSFSIGAGLEYQNVDPTKGMSIRLEKRLIGLPIISIHTRLQATQFAEDITVRNFDNTQDVAAEAKNWDFTAAAFAYFKLPMLPVDPYVGIGAGFDRSMFNVLDAAVNGVQDEATSAISYSTIVGIRLGMIPLIKPFAEYRFAGLTKEPPTGLDKASGRFSFGVAIGF